MLAALTAGALFVAPAGSASAQIIVSAFPVPPTLDRPSPTSRISEVEPAIEPAPDGSNAEWFLLNAQWQDLVSVTPTGTMTKVATGFATDAGAPDAYASVDADGFDWILDNYQGSPEEALYAVGVPGTPSAGVNRVASFDGYSEDMTLSSDGALYIGDNSGNIVRCQITAEPSAACADAPISAPFDGGAYSVGSGGNAVWFTDAAGELNAYSSGTFSGPYWTGASIDPGTMVTAANGDVYVAGGSQAVGGASTELLYFNPADPSDVQVAASGFQDLSSLALGPDGNIWFLDTGADDGVGEVGAVNIVNGAVTEFPLPDGYSLSRGGARIAPGPNVSGPGGTGEVFFTAATSENSVDTAAIGEVSGIPLPVTSGSLALKPSSRVSKRRVATLTLTCDGATNAECAGRLTLSVKARVQVRRQLRAARRGVGAKFRIVIQTQDLSLGNVTYDIRGGSTQRVSMTLSPAAYSVLEQVSGHRWNAVVSATPTVGAGTDTTLVMTGPAPRRPTAKKTTRSRQATTARRERAATAAHR